MHSFFSRLNSIWAYGVMVLFAMAFVNHASVYLLSRETTGELRIIDLTRMYGRYSSRALDGVLQALIDRRRAAGPTRSRTTTTVA